MSSHRALDLIAHHAPPDLVDLGEAGVTPGDQAVLSGTLFRDYDDKQAMRTALVHCTVIAAAGPRHCVGTLVLPEGHIALHGSFTEAGGPDELAVTGGTGRYAKVRGSVRPGGARDRRGRRHRAAAVALSRRASPGGAGQDVRRRPDVLP